MSKLELFTKQIGLISGVEGYIIVRRSGDIITHNMSNPEDLASMVTMSGLGASDIMQTIGFTRFNHLSFNRMGKRDFLIFFLNRYFLGIQQIAGTDDQQLATEISQLLENLLQQNPNEVEHKWSL